MTRLNSTRLALSVLLAGSALVSVAPAQAQPVMGNMGMHHDSERMHDRMGKQIEKRQAELKAKLHLAPAQEPAWTAFVQGIQPPSHPMRQPLEREELAKLSTPERLDKMQTLHETNSKAMTTYMKQRNDATRTFYSQLSVEQQKVFDAETLRGPSMMMDHAGKSR